ncbi:MAG TPA: DNA-binding protein [Ruminococcaceae bacterium]|nr:DNA-binding protein [Oscillospiraceae bacterium]
MQKNLHVSVLLDFYGEMLTQNQRALVGHYYNDDLSLAEIAQHEGITRQGVRDTIKRAEIQMFEMEERLGFIKKHREIDSALEQIRAAMTEIAEFNLRYGCSREINERAKMVYELTERLN